MKSTEKSNRQVEKVLREKVVCGVCVSVYTRGGNVCENKSQSHHLASTIALFVAALGGEIPSKPNSTRLLVRISMSKNQFCKRNWFPVARYLSLSRDARKKKPLHVFSIHTTFASSLARLPFMLSIKQPKARSSRKMEKNSKQQRNCEVSSLPVISTTSPSPSRAMS